MFPSMICSTSSSPTHLLCHTYIYTVCRFMFSSSGSCWHEGSHSCLLGMSTAPSSLCTASKTDLARFLLHFLSWPSTVATESQFLDPSNTLPSRLLLRKSFPTSCPSTFCLWYLSWNLRPSSDETIYSMPQASHFFCTFWPMLICVCEIFCRPLFRSLDVFLRTEHSH